MKRFLFIIFAFCLCITPIAIHAETETTEIHVHYYRYGGDYSDWDVWMWRKAPADGNGAGYPLGTEIDPEYGGRIAKISLTNDLAGSTRVGIIIRKPANWTKDISTDRFIDIPEKTSDGILHVYLVEGDERIGYSLTDPNGPDRGDKIKSAYFTNTKEIVFNLTTELTTDKLVLTADNIVINANITMTNSKGTIKLNSDVDLTKKYVLSATFKDSTSIYNVTFDGIYDSEAFTTTYGYEGNDLGANPTDTKTTFRLWAPISDQVVLNIYDSGTPAGYIEGQVTDKVEHITMTKAEKGTFYYETNTNLHGKYYTYTVTNGNSTNEVVDPYAKSVGINGLRGMIIDFNKINPTGFEYNKRADNIVNPTDAIIYELHIRDLTSHSTWNGTEANRAKYLGLSESGTTYENVTTGFDHIKELGVTHVQILPFFDYGSVDERRVNEKNYQTQKNGAFNWGYMPINYNTLEGGYSANPYDGTVRVQEFKQVVTDYTNANIRINMDVVYNHTGLSADSNFNLIVPGYYYRTNADGTFSNGSGCGNETASERYMMRKFIVESVKFWATEYNISGFRFDLMALHDTETMNAVKEALQAIDESILVYGEPWNGGDSPLAETKRADKVNLVDMPGVGAFNDDIRDSLKGSVFNAKDKGFIQGKMDDTIKNRLKYGVAGGIATSDIDTSYLSYQKAWNTSPLKTINYATCHDNNTLYDKLMQSLSFASKASITDIVEQAYSILATSQGILFIHAGDEFLRSKPSSTGTGFDSNSYESPDSVNQLRWSEKVKYLDTNNYLKNLIKLRKDVDLFRMTDVEKIANNLTFLYNDQKNIFAYQINGKNDKGDAISVLVINNNSETAVPLTLPTSNGWKMVSSNILTGDLSYESNGEIVLLAHESVILTNGVLFTAPTDAPSSNSLVIILGIGGGALVLAIGITLTIIKRKKSRNA